MDREQKEDDVDYNGFRAWNRDASKRSHSIKEIIVDLQLPALYMSPKLFTPTGEPTPRRRGDGDDFHNDYFFNESEDDSKIESETDKYNIVNDNLIENDNEKRTMMDPPGYNENEGAKSTEQSSKKPANAGSIHRRRKRLLEHQARKIMGGGSGHNDNPYKKADIGRIDTTERTMPLSLSSMHSSWVPSREMDKDPNNKPVMTSKTEARLSKQTMEAYERAVPQRSWQPDRQLPEKKRNGRARENGKLDFDVTNEWVPSEFYRRHHQPPQAGRATALHSGIPPIISPYPPTQRQQHQHQQRHQQQQQQQLQQLQQQQRLRHQQEYLQEFQEQYQQQYQQQVQQQQQQQHRQPQHQEYQQYQQYQHQHQQEHHQQVQNVDRAPWRPHHLSQQPPSVIHTITTKSTPSTPTPEIHTITTAGTPLEPTVEDDKMKRKSMSSEMDLSDVVISSTENSTIMESTKNLKGKGKNRISEDSSTIIDSLKAKAKKRRSEDSKDPTSKNSNSKESEESSKLRRQKSKKRWSDESKDPKESEESSTILDSYKALRKGKKDSDDSWNPRDGSLKKIINTTYTFDANDDEFDESLLSASLTHLDPHHTIPNNITIDQFVIPTIFVRKSGTSDITFDVDATRQMIESTLTMSDEDLTFGSTIHNGSTINNSIISQEDAAVAYAAAAAREMALKDRGLNESITSGLIGNNIRARTTLMDSGITGVSESLLGSNTSGYTGNYNNGLLGSNTSGYTGEHIHTNLINSGVSGLTMSGIMGGKDAMGTIIANKLSTLADEIGERARQKMEDIPSEVASSVRDTLSSNRQDSESDDHSSWHHRSNITTNSTMVSTKKAGNRKKKFNPRRSSTSTLPSIGSIIPEELYNYGEEDDESESDDEDLSIYEIHHVSSESSDETDIDEDEIERRLASIPEVGSRDVSGAGTASREFSKADVSRDVEIGERNRGSSGRKKDNSSNDSDSENDNRSSSTMKNYCDCLDIRVFDKGEDGTGRIFNPTCGAYVVMILVVFMIAVWTGIGIVWHRARQSDEP